MSNLVKNELLKLFSKKIIYMLFIMTAIIVIGNTIIGTSIYGGILIDHTEEARAQEQIELSNKINKIDYTKNTNDYIETKTELDRVNLEREYPLGSWQEQVIVKNINKIKQMIKEINIYTYQIEENNKLEELKETYNIYLQPLKENDWKKFVNYEIKEKEENIKRLEEEIIKVKDENEKNNIENLINQYKFDLGFLKIRLEKNISYEKNDRNELIEKYKQGKENLKAYIKDYNQYNYNEKVRYNKIIANVNELEYKIYNNIPTLDEDNARDMLNNAFENYEIIIILIIVIIAGSNVSEEFNKGTIKLLLVKPHKRFKILLCKLLTAVIVLIILLVFMVLVQVLAGGFVYGFEDYNIGIIQYNFDTQKVMNINVFVNILILALAKMPMYLLILIITFSISTIFCNTSIAIILGVLAYLSENIIYVNENIKFSKYLLTANWDFTKYLFGKMPESSLLNLNLSTTICLISIIIITFITFICFNNKDIKNM